MNLIGFDSSVHKNRRENLIRLPYDTQEQVSRGNQNLALLLGSLNHPSPRFLLGKPNRPPPLLTKPLPPRPNP